MATHRLGTTALEFARQEQAKHIHIMALDSSERRGGVRMIRTPRVKKNEAVNHELAKPL